MNMFASQCRRRWCLGTLEYNCTGLEMFIYFLCPPVVVTRYGEVALRHVAAVVVVNVDAFQLFVDVVERIFGSASGDGLCIDHVENGSRCCRLRCCCSDICVHGTCAVGERSSLCPES